MKVLVACEFSGVVRRAFRDLGHDVYSCDLLPAEDGETIHHFQGDALDRINWTSWDLLIAHPPCTYLANSGVRWLYGGKGKIKDEIRWDNMRQAAKFFMRLLNAHIPKIAIENPIMHKYGREIVGTKYSQVIQPWQFGHGETKATCLWLKNLPDLRPTDIVDGRIQRCHKLPPSKDRWKERSRTFIGIAAAMAEQWGSA